MLVAVLMLLAGSLSSVEPSPGAGMKGSTAFVTEFFIVILLVIGAFALLRRVRVMSSDRD